MRILVVDDDEDSRDLTEAALLSAGYTDIVTAASGWEALKILEGGRDTGEPPALDVVLLDIVMPEMDGIETCARIRTDPRCADLPLIMVTVLDDMDSLAHAFVAGATDYVTKPINRVELVARLRSALRLKQELDRRLAREKELLEYLSKVGLPPADHWFDDVTGLLVDAAAERALTGAYGWEEKAGISVVALMLDRLDDYRARHGNRAVQEVVAKVGRAVRHLTAPVGTIAAAYRTGLIVLVVPELGAEGARRFAEILQTTVAKLRLPNPDGVTSDNFTASVAAITGRPARPLDRVQLLAQAVTKVHAASTAGGDRIVSATIDERSVRVSDRIPENLGARGR